MNKILNFIAISFLFVVSGSAKNNQDEGKGSFEVFPVAEVGNPSTKGVVYALPKTELEITIVAQKTQNIRGPFYQYSERYLGLKDVITENEEQWEMVEVVVRPKGVPDPENQFVIKYSGEVAAPYVVVGNNGCIAAVNYFESEFSEEIIREVSLESKEATFDFVPFTEEMLVANSTAKKAEEAAAYIARIRENRTLLLSGEASHAPADGAAMQIALDNLDKLEKQFLELFRGKVIQSVEERHVHYSPKQEVERELMFRFSKFKGMVAKDDFSGEPVFLNIAITDSVNVSDEPLQPETDRKGNVTQPVPNSGLYYRIPGTAAVTLTYSNQNIYSERLQIAQFGKVLTLPISILSEPGQAVLFNANTGAIKAVLNQKY